jgi:hypothetical protein
MRQAFQRIRRRQSHSLGIEVSQATVGRYLPWRPKVPSPAWRSFLHNHLTDIAAIDMFVVATATFRLLYALIVLGHDRRRILHFEVTQNPTQVWLSRQITEVLRDRDASYGPAFRARVRVMPHRLDPPRMFGSHHHLERASLARRPVSVFSIPSHDQNASLAKQGLSAASPHPIALCRQDCCVPGGRWFASSLRTSRRLSYCGDRTGGPVSAWGAVRLLQLYCSHTMAPEPMHGAQVAAAPYVLFDQSKMVSRDLHRQTDSQTGQVFVQDRFLSRDRASTSTANGPGKAHTLETQLVNRADQCVLTSPGLSSTAAARLLLPGSPKT